MRSTRFVRCYRVSHNLLNLNRHFYSLFSPKSLVIYETSDNQFHGATRERLWGWRLFRKEAPKGARCIEAVIQKRTLKLSGLRVLLISHVKSSTTRVFARSLVILRWPRGKSAGVCLLRCKPGIKEMLACTKKHLNNALPVLSLFEFWGGCLIIVLCLRQF